MEEEDQKIRFTMRASHDNIGGKSKMTNHIWISKNQA